jgi:tetratricopeptide (TPR) repeat protein
MHRLWGDATLGYHLVNIVLHACSAWLVFLILRRLAIPGAMLAAAIFALHPVEVESVAWMTELKNTLSGVCYLASALTYLRFDSSRSRREYVAAFVLFVLALLSKTVTTTLPAALIVVFWWQRGTLRWREDVAPLLPFFGIGIAGGLLTASVERSQIGAQGAAFQFTLVERCLIAGRAFWFYLWKLFWPTNLMFIYPRWRVSQQEAWQFLYPLAALALAAGLWALHKKSRAPLAAMLLFAGTLFPALGFVNVYPFIFSFVADHFQYLAGVPIMALVSAAIATSAARWLRTPAAVIGACAVLVTPLAAVTWHQMYQYADAETLYRTTLEKNPSCWMCHNNLGELLMARSRTSAPDPTHAILDEALDHFRMALSLNPNFAEAHNNRGSALLELDRFADAAAEYREAQRLKPDIAMIRENLGLVERKRGFALQAAGRLDEALAAYGEALAIDPNDSEAHGLVADVLAGEQKFADAIPHYQQFVAAHPHDGNGWTGLGVALIATGDRTAAIAAFERAVATDPNNPQFKANLARARTPR